MANLGAWALALAAIFGAAVVSSQPAAGRRPKPDVGPQVGQRVPDFALPDQDGRIRTRDALGGPGGLMLVFFRSADW